MKSTRYFLLTICLFGSISAYSQEMLKQSQALAGTWQMVVAIKGEQNQLLFRYLPLFKILNANGTFCNLQIDLRSGRAHFNQEGRFNIQTDSTYIEHIEKSPHASYAGIESPMKYKFIPEEKVLLTQYFNPDTKQWIPEMWIRVEIPEKSNPEK